MRWRARLPAAGEQLKIYANGEDYGTVSATVSGKDITVTSSHKDSNLYINYPDGSRDIVIDLAKDNLFDYEEEFYFEYLEHYIDLFVLQPNENGVIELSKEELHRLILEDFTDIYDNEMKR